MRGGGRTGFSRSGARVGRGAKRGLVLTCDVRDAASFQLRGGGSAVRPSRGYGADVQHLPDRGARSDGVGPDFEAVSGRAELDPLTISRTGGRFVPGGSDLRESRAQSLVSESLGDCPESKARSIAAGPGFVELESSRFLWRKLWQSLTTESMMPPDGACRNDFRDVPVKVFDSLPENFDKNLTTGGIVYRHCCGIAR